MATKKQPPITSAPCARCPFRKDVPMFLRPGRRAEFAEALVNQQTFLCHGTVDYSDDEPDSSNSSECAGSVKSLALIGGSTQHSRVVERLGLVDLDRIEEHPVEVWDLNTWKRVPEGETGDTWDPEEDEEPEVETCTVCGPNCIAPAGYMGSGGAVTYGTEAADDNCLECGEAVCSECISSNGTCDSCEWDED